GGRGFGERQQHELPGVESKTLLDQNSVQGTAEGHQLRLDALDVRNAAKAFEHLAQQHLTDRELWVARRDKQPAHQSLVLLEYVEAVAGGLAVLHRGATSKRARVKELHDQVERAAVVPVQLFAPMPRLFLEQRLELAGVHLAQVHDGHGGRSLCSW